MFRGVFGAEGAEKFFFDPLSTRYNEISKRVSKVHTFEFSENLSIKSTQNLGGVPLIHLWKLSINVRVKKSSNDGPKNAKKTNRIFPLTEFFARFEKGLYPQIQNEKKSKQHCLSVLYDLSKTA